MHAFIHQHSSPLTTNCKSINIAVLIMGFLQTFLPPEDRYAALMLYGMVFATCFNDHDAGIMTAILLDEEYISHYNVDANSE
jgi:hypothetical protein